MLASSLTLTVGARPLRVAYLLDRTSVTTTEIDNIIRTSVEHWGGRFHALIPVDAGELTQHWWDFLVSTDPDFIVAQSPLTDSVIERINRCILPARILLADAGEKERYGEQWPFHYDGMSQLTVSTVPRNVLSVWQGDDHPLFLFVKDRSDAATGAFALRNFGALPDVISTVAMFKDVPSEELDPQGLSVPELLEKTIPQRIQPSNLPQTRPQRFRVILPIDLCRFFTSRSYDTSYHQFAAGFHLVVGDSPDDVIYAWNRDLISDLSNSRGTLWLSESMCSDDEVLESVSRWIQRSFWGASQNSFGTVISYSIPEANLHAIGQALAQRAGIPFTGTRLQPDQFPISSAHPRPLSRRAAAFAPRFRSLPPASTIQVPLSNEEGLFDSPLPMSMLPDHAGGWMVDFEMEYRPEQFAHWHPRPSWQLPQRLGMADLFVTDRLARITSGGLLSTHVNGSEITIRIRIPSDFDIVHPRVARWRDNVYPARPTAELDFPEIWPSKEGRSLAGLLRVFGGLEAVGEMFEDSFWRETLVSMAGRPVKEVELAKIVKALRDAHRGTNTPQFVETPRRVNPIRQFLARWWRLFGNKRLVCISRSDERLMEFAEYIWGRLRVGEPAPDWRTEKNLKDDFRRMYHKAGRTWDDEFTGGKARLEYLLERRVMLFGAAIRCPVCYTWHWFHIDDLKRKPQCSGCLSRFPMPLNPEWSFRLNAMVAEALRAGTLPVAHALHELRIVGHGSFLFVPPQDVFPREGQNKPTDVDLLGIVNRKLFIGEVKASVGGFKEKDFDALQRIALDWRPELVIVAAEGEAWSAEVEGWLEALRSALAHYGIGVFPMLLDWDATSFPVP